MVAFRRWLALFSGRNEKTLQLLATGFFVWCGWQELNPRPLGS